MWIGIRTILLHRQYTVLLASMGPTARNIFFGPVLVQHAMRVVKIYKTPIPTEQVLRQSIEQILLIVRRLQESANTYGS